MAIEIFQNAVNFVYLTHHVQFGNTNHYLVLYENLYYGRGYIRLLNTVYLGGKYARNIA